jgi:beta-lactamase regulating signal transducer with metallopeptidase domain
MEPLLAIMLSNALVGGVAAGLAWVAGRLLRRPAVAHALWLVVLLKLITPPIWTVPLFHLPRAQRPVTAMVSASEKHAFAALEKFSPDAPDSSLNSMAAIEPRHELVLPDTTRAPDQAPLSDDVEEADVSPPDHDVSLFVPERNAKAIDPLSPAPNAERPALARKQPHRAEHVSFSSWRIIWPLLRSWRAFLVPALFLVWLAGSLYCLAVTLVRIVVFQRLLKYATLAGPEVQRQALALALGMGLPERRVPGVWLVPGAVCPMLWGGFRGRGGTRVLVPERLWAELDASQRRTLLVHELAHLHRRDHWVRWIEVGATVLYWWDPMCWWTRQQLREAEEQCCDAWVLHLMPGSFRAYAEALLAAVEFISTAGSVAPRPEAVPALASGMGQFGHLKRRLTMLKQNPTDAHALLGKAGLALACAAAALLLPMTPTVARQQDAQETRQKTETDQTKAESAAVPVAKTVTVTANSARFRTLTSVVPVNKTVTVTVDAEPSDDAVAPREKRAVEVDRDDEAASAPAAVPAAVPAAAPVPPQPPLAINAAPSADAPPPRPEISNMPEDPAAAEHEPFRGDPAADQDRRKAEQDRRKMEQDRDHAMRDLARAQAEVATLSKRLNEATVRLQRAQMQLMRSGMAGMPGMATGAPGAMMIAPDKGGMFFGGYGIPKGMPNMALPDIKGQVPLDALKRSAEERDRRVDRLERQLSQLLNEVRSLREEHRAVGAASHGRASKPASPDAAPEDEDRGGE